MIGTLRFAGDLPTWLVFAGALLAAAGVIWYYSRETDSLGIPYGYLLPGLRAAAVALVILVLAGPVWHTRMTVGELGRVTFALDRSLSMSLTDAGSESSRPERLQRAMGLLLGNQVQSGWLQELLSTHQIDLVAFDRGAPSLLWSSQHSDEVPIDLQLQAEGVRTDLSSPLDEDVGAEGEAAGASTPTSRHAIVLFSDGRDNAGGSAVEAAERFAAIGGQVHAIGLGSQDEPDEVGIANVVHPESVASDGRLAGELVLSSAGMVGEEFSLRIESGDEVVWQETFTSDTDGEQRIPFEFDVQPVVDRIAQQSSRGVRRSTVVMDLRAMIDPVAKDHKTENNAMAFRVAASTRDRRLLILDGSSRWETRYLRNLFERDPVWTVDTVLYGEGTDMEEVERGDEPGQFPNSAIAMARYDAIVLGQVPPDQWTDDDTDLLRDFVTRGGGLVIVDGRYGRLEQLARDHLAELIPVKYLEQPAMPVREISPTPIGMDHPVLNLWGAPEESAEFWKRSKAPPTTLRLQPQSGSEVWAYALSPDGRESPWLVTRLYGAGRVFYLATDQTWRWRYKVADRFHARFWNQLLGAVMQPPYAASDEYVSLGTDKIEYDVDESATVRVRLQDTDGQPVGDATVDALWVQEGQVVMTVPLSVDNADRGTYRGETPPLKEGEYEVRVRASGFDSRALLASTPVWVGSRDSMELMRLSLDEEMLSRVAAMGDGQYRHESSAEDLIRFLKPLSAGRIVESDVLLWQSFYWFWAIMGLLTVEWLLRKKAGLV